MIFMTILKVIFVLLLCLPLAYVMVYFLTRLIDEVVSQNKKNQDNQTDRSRRR